jgi:hypothetical protein
VMYVMNHKFPICGVIDLHPRQIKLCSDFARFWGHFLEHFHLFRAS